MAGSLDELCNQSWDLTDTLLSTKHPAKRDDESEVEPENGHYIALRMVATASEEFDPRVTTPIADYDFRVLGDDGAEFDPATPAGWACYGAPRLIQNMRIGPGYEYDGWMVLDVPVTSGSLVYAPGDEPYGWEWQF